LVQRGEGHRGEHGAGGDQGVKLGHVLYFSVRSVIASMKRTYRGAVLVAVTRGTHQSITNGRSTVTCAALGVGLVADECQPCHALTLPHNPSAGLDA
jgi:hypothetical protein